MTLDLGKLLYGASHELRCWQMARATGHLVSFALDATSLHRRDKVAAGLIDVPFEQGVDARERKLQARSEGPRRQPNPN